MMAVPSGGPTTADNPRRSRSGGILASATRARHSSRGDSLAKFGSLGIAPL